MANAAVAAEEVTHAAVADALWGQVEDVCGSEAFAYEAAFPGVFKSDIIESGRIELPRDGEGWPMSAENKQIVAYVMVQAAQVISVLQYEAAIREFFADGVAIDVATLERARAATDLATCLMPLGDRFSTSEEEGIALLAHLVTKDVICKKWFAFSNETLATPVATMTQDDYVVSWIALGERTIQSCEESS